MKYVAGVLISACITIWRCADCTPVRTSAFKNETINPSRSRPRLRASLTQGSSVDASLMLGGANSNPGTPMTTLLNPSTDGVAVVVQIDNYSFDDLDDDVGTLVRSTISAELMNILCNGFPASAPGPAPAPGPASLAAEIRQVTPMPAPAPGAAPSPAQACPQVSVNVLFEPGPPQALGGASLIEAFTIQSAAFGGASVMVGAVITSNKESEGDPLPYLKSMLESNEKALVDRLGRALNGATANPPDISAIVVSNIEINTWSLAGCQQHMVDVVNEFSHSYSRRQVPVALYNECTNFLPALSFGGNGVLDQRDKTLCQSMTKAFTDRWNAFTSTLKVEKRLLEPPWTTPAPHAVHGKAPRLINAPPVIKGKNNGPFDFSSYCLDVCRAKFSLGSIDGAPACLVKVERTYDVPADHPLSGRGSPFSSLKNTFVLPGSRAGVRVLNAKPGGPSMHGQPSFHVQQRR